MSLKWRFMLAPLAALLTLIILIGVFYHINDKQNKILESLLIEQQQTSYKFTFFAHQLAVNHAEIFLLLKNATLIADEGEFYDQGRKLLLNIHNIEQNFYDAQGNSTLPSELEEIVNQYNSVTSNVILVASVDLDIAKDKMNDSTIIFNELNNQLLILSESSQKSTHEKIIAKQEELKKDAVISVSLALLLMLVSTSITLILSSLLSKKLNHLIHYLRKVLIERGETELSITAETDEITTLSAVSEEVQKTVNQLESEIDNRKKAEDTILELNRNLEKNVVNRTEDLQRTNLELTQTLDELKSTQKKLIENDKMASLGGLVAGVAHELNTPIGNALTGISFIEDKLKTLAKDLSNNQLTKTQFDEGLQEIWEASSVSLTSISRAVEQIESFKLVAVDTTVDTAREIELRPYLEDIIRSLTPKFKRSKHQIELHCADDAIIESYPGAFVQIFTNLISNSFIHAFDEDQQGKINIDITAHKNSVEILYSDNGKGVSKATKASIFDPFFTTNRKGGGTGLGAHIIYNLVTQRLHGDIEIVEQKSSGLCFHITVPKTLEQ